MARRRHSTLLLFSVVILGLAVLVGVFLLPAVNYGGVDFGIGDLLGSKGVQSSIALSVIDDQGNTVAVFQPSSQKLAVIATSGEYSQDITTWISSVAGYYFKLNPQVKPTFTADGSAKIVYDFTWDVKYPAETATSSYTGRVFPLSHIAQAQSPVNLPYTATFTDSAPKSGSWITVEDTKSAIVVKINGMQVPEPGKSYTMRVDLKVTAKLYVNNELAGTLTQSVPCTITITNKPSGQLSALDVSIKVGSAYAMW